MTDNNHSDESNDSDAELINNATWTSNNPIALQGRSKDPHRRLSLNTIVDRMNPKPAKQSIDPSFQPKVLRKNNSITRTESVGSLVKESKVLVIYTGGTIGMVKNAQGGTPTHPAERVPSTTNLLFMHLQFTSHALVPLVDH